MMKPRVLILHASGTNRDRDALEGCERAGGEPEIVHINQLRAGARHLENYQMLVIPGGFSYADALGAGQILALMLRTILAEDLAVFVASGKPVLGICNGFQALVKAGLLPADAPGRTATLSYNPSGHFECRWVTLQPNPGSRCIFTQGLDGLIDCPVAHGEGNFIPGTPDTLEALQTNGQIALSYVHPDGSPAAGRYPANPNGSVADIAGVCNPAGNVLGLMPHPEDHIYPQQHPLWTRGRARGLGLGLFANGIQYARQV